MELEIFKRRVLVVVEENKEERVKGGHAWKIKKSGIFFLFCLGEALNEWKGGDGDFEQYLSFNFVHKLLYIYFLFNVVTCQLVNGLMF